MLPPLTPCPQMTLVTCQREDAVPSDPLPIIEGVKGGTYVPLVTFGKTCPRFALTLSQNLT